MSRSRLLAAVAALVLSSAPAAAGEIYLAIGDSSAFGETDRTKNPSNGDRGYVAPFADYLAGLNGGQRPTVLNLAINGETSSSYTAGTGRVSADGIFLNSNYAGYAPNYPTQHDEVMKQIAAAKARGDSIPTVTVQFGANDLFAVAGSDGFLKLDPAVQLAMVTQQVGVLQQNYAALLTELKQQLPDAELYLIGYHNPYPGKPEHPLAPLSKPAVEGVNAVAYGMSQAFGAHYVDFYHVVLGREKELTLIARDDELNNVHMTEAGYALAAQELIRVASGTTPEPGTLALLAVAAVGAAGYRRVRRRAS
jgi:lysophospholipase L1-like esterase